MQDLANVLARARGEEIVIGEPVRVLPAASGTLNDMLSIEYADGSRYYWKRFLPHLDAPWVETPVDRMRVELGALRAFRDVLGSDIQLPVALMVDEAEHWVLLSDARPIRGGNWQEAFLKGAPEISTDLAARLGIAFAKLARSSPNQPLRANFDADSAHWNNWLRLRTVTTLQYDPPISQSAKQALQKLYEQGCACTGRRLLHVDLVPKNIMVSPDAAGLIDFELCTTMGDAPFDLGLFLGHIGLFLINRRRIMNKTWADVLDRIAASYLSLMQLDSAQQQRVIRYAGAAMLYREAGATRMPFLDRRAAGRQLAAAECLLTSHAALHEYQRLLASTCSAD
jgi:aminoglycoside phosphotransferase (APT) family kinase protein